MKYGGSIIVLKYLYDRFDVNFLELKIKMINSRGFFEVDLCVYICDFLMFFFLYNSD